MQLPNHDTSLTLGLLWQNKMVFVSDSNELVHAVVKLMYFFVFCISGMTLFLCMKAALSESQLLEHCFQFHIASATYLTHVATSKDLSRFAGISFPLSEDAPRALSYVPEFIADNIMDFMLFIRRFADAMYEVRTSDILLLLTHTSFLPEKWGLQYTWHRLEQPILPQGPWDMTWLTPWHSCESVTAEAFI